jgi:chaperonin cofactor prefoldin
VTRKEGNEAQRFAAMHRMRELRSSLEHCRAWKRQLETQLSEFAGVVDNPNPQQEHQIKALQSDLESAQNNVSSLQKQLDDLMD